MIVTRTALAGSFLLTLLASPALSQGPSQALADHAVTTWSEKDGLPAGRIRALAQGAEGYLWIGTETGLVRFDGLRFVPWNASHAVKLPPGAVSALISARDGSLWVGLNGPTSVARMLDGRVTLYGEADGLPSNMVTTFYEDPARTVWAGTLAGLYRFDGRRWDRVDLGAGSGPEPVLAVHEDREGRLWAVTPAAVFRRPGPGAAFERAATLDIASNVWQSMSADKAGTVWISDFQHGFRRLVDGRRTAQTATRRGWGVQLLHDRQGTMWVATQGQGLWRVRTDGSGVQDTSAMTVHDGLASNAVQALLEDREGNIWLGTSAGLQRLSPHRVTPLRDVGIARVLATTPDGAVWVGTAEGLSRFSAAGRRDFTPADGLPGSVVLALHADGAGGLWIATERGVVRYAGGRFTPLQLPETQHMQRVFGMTGRGGDLWLRDFFYRLYHWLDGELLPLGEVPEAHRKNVFTVFEDRSRRMWIGSAGGRLGRRSPDGSFKPYDLPIGAIIRLFEDRDGTLWAGGDEGLSRIAGDDAVSITRAQGFPGSVKAIVEDAKGDLWVGIGTGIIRLEKSQFARAVAKKAAGLRYRFFNVADGVAGIPVAEGAHTGVRAADGRLWFVTSGGVTLIDPDRVGDPPPMPPVRIESVTADAQQFDPAAGVFKPKRTSHFHMAFTALSLTDPTRIRFRYRLEGFDHDWVEAGPSREAVYTNLPPRNYRFVVEATNGDGVWSPGASWTFGITPMFYQTYWFYLACAVALGLLVAAGWRLRVQHVRRQFALVLAERIRMSRAIHDTLLQGLAGLALQVDDLSHNLEGAQPSARARMLRMRRQIEEYIREARQSIWDLRSPRLAARDLPQALREAGERAIGDRPVRLDLVVRGTPHRCPPVVEEQLLLIGQEAVNNAVQHGSPTRVGVEIDYDDDRTRLRVSDDGCGFDPGAAAAGDGHYGLVSMRERAGQVKGQIVIASVPGEGTQVEAVVPTA